MGLFALRGSEIVRSAVSVRQRIGFTQIFIALVDAVHAQNSRAIGKGLAPLADVDLGRAGL